VIAASAGELSPAAGWRRVRSSRPDCGARPGAGHWGRNRVRAVMKARIFEMTFSA
jgi:hypothetical protein